MIYDLNSYSFGERFTCKQDGCIFIMTGEGCNHSCSFVESDLITLVLKNCHRVETCVVKVDLENKTLTMDDDSIYRFDEFVFIGQI